MKIPSPSPSGSDGSSEVQKKPDWTLSNFLSSVVCFLLQSAIPIHARRLSHNPPTSKKAHINSHVLSFTDLKRVQLRSWVSGGKQPRFVVQLLHLHVRCSAPGRIPAGRLVYKWKAVFEKRIKTSPSKIQECRCQWEFNTTVQERFFVWNLKFCQQQSVKEDSSYLTSLISGSIQHGLRFLFILFIIKLHPVEVECTM